LFAREHRVLKKKYAQFVMSVKKGEGRAFGLEEKRGTHERFNERRKQQELSAYRFRQNKNPDKRHLQDSTQPGGR